MRFEEWMKAAVSPNILKYVSPTTVKKWEQGWNAALTEVERMIQEVAVLNAPPDGDYERGEDTMARLILKKLRTLRTDGGT